MSFLNRPGKKLNLDITHRCPLQCHLCGRQRSFRYQGLKVPGYDISIADFNKISNFFPEIAFCGQYSDPIHHPNFIKMLEICYKKSINAEVHVASSYKSEKWFCKAFEACPDAEWVFGIDGLPEDSHRYRINQDGVKLYEIMKLSKRYLKTTPKWQYIVFSYNQDNIDQALAMAKQEEFEFHIINSARFEDDDAFRPTLKEYQ